ncbi:hypothetical protein LWI29_026963 [Acer saccharum]|uniref:Uncharacterized protein n=1 Tax=Acer saccharum TaxID=4024 RepID=A0AA39RR75_ACESA|nr:hypothetical protein LWI29_026963 [Acer saccharum]
MAVDPSPESGVPSAEEVQAAAGDQGMEGVDKARLEEPVGGGSEEKLADLLRDYLQWDKETLSYKQGEVETVQASQTPDEGCQQLRMQ